MPPDPYLWDSHAPNGKSLVGHPSNASYLYSKQNQNEMSTGNWGSIQEIIMFSAPVSLASGPQLSD